MRYSPRPGDVASRATSAMRRLVGAQRVTRPRSAARTVGSSPIGATATAVRGSGEFPGEDLALASWLPVSKGLTPQGLRHGHRVWMDEDKIPLVLQADRLGHDKPGMRGIYGHVSDSMRDEIKAALEARWRQSLL